MKFTAGKKEIDTSKKNWIADTAYAYVKGNGPEPYAPAVASFLFVLLETVFEAARDVGQDDAYDEGYSEGYDNGFRDAGDSE